jgi:SAM-dependent methyltransferase
MVETGVDSKYVIGHADHDAEVARLKLQHETGFGVYSAAFFRSVAIQPQDFDSVILNPGAGAGTEWSYLHPYARIIEAIDINPQNGYEESIKKFNLRDIVRYTVGTATKLPYEDESANISSQRIFWEHLSNQDRQLAGKEMLRVLKPGGLVVAEDLDFSPETWRMTPQSEAFTTLQRAMLLLYEKGGFEPAMGPKLADFLKDLGLNIVEERSYNITTPETHPFRMAHWGILNSIGPGLVARGIMLKEDVDKNLDQLKADLNKPGMKIFSPTICQVAARKPL